MCKVPVPWFRSRFQQSQMTDSSGALGKVAGYVPGKSCRKVPKGSGYGLICIYVYLYMYINMY